MDEFVPDTHALYWYLAAMPQLSQAAKGCFDSAAGGEAMLLIPAIVVAELYYLNAKLGTPLDFATEFGRLSAAPQVDSLAIPEMHDRIIAGVALSRGCPCITRDPAIAAAGIVKTIW